MLGDDEERGPPTSLRGPLSEIYFPALLDGAREHLAVRLGFRATVDDPVCGRAVGFPALEQHLTKTLDWLETHDAAFTKSQFFRGTDRDVTCGTLSIRIERARIDLPVAVVAERRKLREVELRIYFSTRAFSEGTARGVRKRLVPASPDLPLPKIVTEHMEAIKTGSLDGTLACFEVDAALIEAHGTAHVKRGDALRTYYARLFGAGGVELERGGYADDGRSCAFEYSAVRLGGRDVSYPGLAIYERGENGLINSLRLYEDLE